MKTLTNQTRYKCEYCPKEYKRAHYVPAHEENCSKNPKNQHLCFGCKFLVKGTAQGEAYDRFPKEYTTFICSAQDGDVDVEGYENKLELFSYKAGLSLHESGLIGRAVRMPNKGECSHFRPEFPDSDERW